ncbi:xylanase inhibitor protein 2-like [Oryza brachyantha]|uniref:GH18 domain-containing protein n=1 Tax=Oryza brachyantha TaxID=4533 RepID=J3NAE2_ORYBR|nr:xylanase inhibitor protein 2-like [Oryza brachyantha]
MASFRRRSCIPAALLPLAFFLLLASKPTAGDVGTAVVWGRHADEGTLREACDTGHYNTVIISFYSVFGHGRYSLDLSGHDLRDVGSHIKHCQRKGIVVLLSIGGQGGDYSLPSSQSASDVADNLWNSVLAGRRKGVFRPFGNAVVDGIDFFIDRGSGDHYDQLARKLDGYSKYGGGKKGVMLTATPRCEYPDRRLEKALATGLFARIHVRMFGAGEENCTAAPREAWEKWAAAYPGSQVCLGLVASSGQDAGYLSPKELYYTLVMYIRDRLNYGGRMIWDRYYDKITDYSIGRLI